MPRLSAAIRALIMPALAGLVFFTVAGSLDFPVVWGLLTVLALFGLTMAAVTDPTLLEERARPGAGNQDRLTVPLSLLLFVAHWVIGGLDAGRFHWSPIPLGVQLVGLAGYAAAMGVLLWAVLVNRYYSSVVRVQTDRGHEVITTGPYRFVRHPGYAASIAGSVLGGLTLGSWLALVPVLGFVVLFVRRTLLEDQMLLRDLAGYREYAERVRYRLVPGLL